MLKDVALYCSDLKNQRKQNKKAVYMPGLVFTGNFFLFNFHNVKLNRKLVNRSRDNNVYVLMQMGFSKITIKLFQCYFSLK